MTLRVVQIAAGILFALVGVVVIGAALAVLVLAKGVTAWGVALVAVGAILMFLGGVLIPNSGVEDGAKKVSVFVTPLLPFFPAFGGRRATDPPAPVAPPPPKEGP